MKASGKVGTTCRKRAAAALCAASNTRVASRLSRASFLMPPIATPPPKPGGNSDNTSASNDANCLAACISGPTEPAPESQSWTGFATGVLRAG